MLALVSSDQAALVRRRSSQHTNLVQFHQEEFGIFLAQQRLGGATIWAVALGEDHDIVLVDDLLSLGLCGRHAVG